MRILVGTMEICRHVHDLGVAFRALGHDVDTAVVGKSPFYQDLPYNYVINPIRHHNLLSAVVQNPIGALIDLPDELLTLRRLLTDYDVYVFQFARSLLPLNQDYPILKQQGKKIISLFNGSDIRHWSAAEPVAASFGYQIPEMCREDPYRDLTARLTNLRMAERYADVIFSLPFQSELAVRPYWHFFLPFDVGLYDHRIPARDIPVVVHAPSRRKFKGTDRFLAVMDRLRDEGVQFELKLLEGVANAQVIRELVDADVVLDELNSPHYAMLALEGMATGCAVVAGTHFGYVPMQGRAPIVNVRPETLYDQVKELLTNKDLRLNHARRGRPFVAAVHSHIDVAASMLSKLELRDGYFDYYPSFVSRQYEVPAGEQIDDGLQRLTAQIIQRHGLPQDVAPESLVERGLMAGGALTPDKPILRWRPAATFGVEEHSWGWAPNEQGTAAVDSVYVVTHLVEKALEALDRGDSAEAAAILQQCIERYQADPGAFSDPLVLTALGRLAVELDHNDAAVAMLVQAHQADPSNGEAARAVEALVGKQAA